MRVEPQMILMGEHRGPAVVGPGHRRAARAAHPRQRLLHRAFDGAHVVGLSILSGSHVVLVEEVLNRLREKGAGHIPVVVGGIIPPEDERRLLDAGVARIYTPKDFDLTRIMGDIVDVVEKSNAAAA